MGSGGLGLDPSLRLLRASCCSLQCGQALLASAWAGGDGWSMDGCRDGHVKVNVKTAYLPRYVLYPRAHLLILLTAHPTQDLPTHLLTYRASRYRYWVGQGIYLDTTSATPPVG